MYLQHFGLQRQPFKITPDTTMFYTGNKRGAALEALKYAILSGEGIIKVVGEVGSGKTMLCRMLELELEEHIEVVYIANPSLSPDNILHVIAFELKLDITATSNKLEVMQTLQNYLLDKHAHNNQVVVFVEEAQSMPVETLEEIRLLSNLETNDYKLLQMVLFGQPELDEKLRLPSIRQLKERITHNFYLEPFPAADVYSYLNFRMRAVGYRGPDLFTPKVANNIERKSNGLTRRINILADKALLAAFSDGGHNIHAKHIKLAAKDSDFGQEFSWSFIVKPVLAISIIIFSIWTGTFLPGLLSSHQTEKDIPGSNANIKHNSLSHLTDTSSTQHKALLTTTEKPDNGNTTSRRNAPSTQTDTSAKHSSTVLQPLSSDLSNELRLTQHWIEHAADDNYTIQLMLLDIDAENDILNYLKKASQLLQNQQLYIYQVSIRGRILYSVLYSEYTQRKVALNQLQKLSPWLKKNRPFLRTIKGIKADIHNTKQLISSSGGAIL